MGNHKKNIQLASLFQIRHETITLPIIFKCTVPAEYSHIAMHESINSQRNTTVYNHRIKTVNIIPRSESMKAPGQSTVCFNLHMTKRKIYVPWLKLLPNYVFLCGTVVNTLRFMSSLIDQAVKKCTTSAYLNIESLFSHIRRPQSHLTKLCTTKQTSKNDAFINARQHTQYTDRNNNLETASHRGS